MQNDLVSEFIRRRLWVLVVVAAVAGGSVAVGLACGGSDAERTIREFQYPPAYTPRTLPAVDPRVSDDDPVLGIEVGGVYRAYALSAFQDTDLHVVNDLLADTPVTVTYCPRMECSRVFSDPGATRRLGVSVGGWVGQTGEEALLLRVGNDLYYQDTGESVREGSPFPYPEVMHTRTTWGAWRRQHPNTTLYAGQ